MIRRADCMMIMNDEDWQVVYMSLESLPPSQHAPLYYPVPKVEVLVLSVQLVVGDQRQRLVYLPAQQLPVPPRLPSYRERPENLLN